MKTQKLKHNNKEYEIYQENDVFNVTSDSVSLVEFVKIKLSDKTIIDFGSGIGTICFLLATKTHKRIIGFEIQKELVELCNKSIILNHLEKQIEIINDKIQNCTSYLKNNSVDLIVSNPPYFKKESTFLKNISLKKAIARHELMITFDEIIKEANKILKNEGRIIFIHRTERLLEIIEILKKYHFEAKRLQFIYTNFAKKSDIFIMEAVKNGKPGLKIEPPQIRKD